MLLITLQGTGWPHQNDLPQMSGPLLKCWWVGRDTHVGSLTPGWGEGCNSVSSRCRRRGPTAPPGDSVWRGPLAWLPASPGTLPHALTLSGNIS